MKAQFYLSSLILFFTINSNAQQEEWNKQLLLKTKGKKVVKWISSENESEWLAIVNIKKKVGIYLVGIESDWDIEGIDSLYVGDVDVRIPAKYDEIGNFVQVDENSLRNHESLAFQHVEIAEAKKKNQKGIIVKYGDPYDFRFIDAETFFDDIHWNLSKGSYVPVLQNDKWGLYDWFDQYFLFDCNYSSIDELPKTSSENGFTEYTASLFKNFNNQNKNNQIDMIDMDNENGDGLFKSRNKESQKWGLYQYMNDEFVEAIPMKYDSLYHFPWNAYYTAVFNDGKVGFYLSYWSYDEQAKQSVPCIYDDYKRFKTEDQTPVLAVEKDGKWGWIDWLTGTEKSEFKYASPDDLPYPHYEQKVWIED